MGYNCFIEVIQLYEIRVEIAEVPFLIRCRFEGFRTFFRNYLSEKEPRFTIAPTDADLEAVDENLDRTGADDGLRIGQRSIMYLEQNAIHALLAEKMTSENVLLMHGSALSYDGEAVIFTAKSGTGKSTHTRLWREIYGDRVVMINDDKPLLKIEDGGVTVWGTPWNGKHHLSRNISAPLKAVVGLERSTVNRIDKLSAAGAFPMLMEASYKSKDPATSLRIIAMERKMLNAADFYVLGCNTDTEAARVSCSGIFGPDRAMPND